VVDESSYIKTYNAKRSKNILLAGKLAKGRMILSGTEITNTPLDLFMQFEVLMPGFWGVKNFFLFRARYALLEDSYGPGGRTFKKVVGFQRMQELMDRIAPYCSRALKKDCLDLPDKIHIRMDVDLSASQERVYGDLKANLMALISGNVLTVPNKIALFTKFRQVTGGAINIEAESTVIDPDPPKLQALLADLQDTDESAIITAAFTHEIEMLVRELSKIAPTAAFYGGNVNARDAGIEAFTKGKIRFMVLNPQAGAFGLNLQDNCHLQYSYSRVLSPSQNWQMEDRIHRPGQREVCVYKTLVARGTVDERIEELLASKTDIRTKFQDMTIADIINLV
jgi:SNF2 family DNA or RNA helicase